MPASKIAAYIQERTNGLAPMAAALAVGYSQSGVAVQCTRLEQREDVRQALRAAKRGARVGKIEPPAPRHGDGESPLEPWRLRDKYANPLELMLDVMNNPKAPGGLRIQCAKDAMPYMHARKEGGKKDDEKDRAKRTNEKSKFGTMAQPLRRVA